VRPLSEQVPRHIDLYQYSGKCVPYQSKFRDISTYIGSDMLKKITSTRQKIPLTGPLKFRAAENRGFSQSPGQNQC
jgi:hypothetical protein